MYIHMYVCTCMCVYIYIYMCIYIYMYNPCALASVTPRCSDPFLTYYTLHSLGCMPCPTCSLLVLRKVATP